MKEIKGFKNVTLVLKDKVIRGNLSFKDGRIASFDEVEGAIELDEGLYLAPGFVDEHIHGANGHDFMDADHAAYKSILTKLPEEGVTSVLSTTMTMDKGHIKSALKAIASYKEGDGARIVGVHLEGPFISVKHKGAQDPAAIQKPTIGAIDAFIEDAKGMIKIVTFAPEEAERGFTAHLKEAGITPSVGHSDAASSVVKASIEEGLSSVTHTYNAQRGFAHREVGIVGEALIQDSLSTELIADLIHVSADAIKLLFRSKPKGKICLISDSTEGKYLAPGEYELGGQPVYILDGVARLKDGTIAGSILKLNQALRNVAPLVPDYSLSDLVNCVSLNPAKNIGLDNEIGSIEIGKRADLTVFDKDFNIVMTLVGGKIAYMKGE